MLSYIIIIYILFPQPFIVYLFNIILLFGLFTLNLYYFLKLVVFTTLHLVGPFVRNDIIVSDLVISAFRGTKYIIALIGI